MQLRRGRGRVAALVVTVALVGGVGGVVPATASVPQAPPPEPESDPFYEPPAGFEQAAPGTVLRSRAVTARGLGIPLPVEATQVLVRTDDATGDPVATAATVLVPPRPSLFGVPLPYPGGRRPLVAYQPFTDGLAARCEPSYEIRTSGLEAELALLAPMLSQGYVVVIPDHQGPRHAYGVGHMAGHATLDSIRAAESLPGTGLAGTDTPVGLWGYSGGAIATGWAAELHPSYAPELDIVGAAHGGTAADFLAVARWMDGGPFSSIMFMVLVGLGREYPEFRSFVNEAGLAVEADLADACIEEGALAYPFRRMEEFSTIPDPLHDPRVIEIAERLGRMGSTAPEAPVYLYHGLLDEGIPFAQARQLRDDWCAAGGAVVFRPVLGEHITTMATEAPAVARFLTDRFARRPLTGACT